MGERLADAQKIELIADVLRDEFYEVLQDAAGAGETYNYEAFAARLLALVEQSATRTWDRGLLDG